VLASTVLQCQEKDRGEGRGGEGEEKRGRREDREGRGKEERGKEKRRRRRGGRRDRGSPLPTSCSLSTKILCK
jgi:hypothetical protein